MTTFCHVSSDDEREGIAALFLENECIPASRISGYVSKEAGSPSFNVVIQKDHHFVGVNNFED